jgi:hypothetical protein
VGYTKPNNGSRIIIDKFGSELLSRRQCVCVPWFDQRYAHVKLSEDGGKTQCGCMYVCASKVVMVKFMYLGVTAKKKETNVHY